MSIFLYNTLSLKKEEFKPIVAGQVGLYTCGPTVYNYAHLGNLRTYLFEDLLKRVLLYNGYDVKHVMNITDVGHLTGDMDMGEDKLELGARREHKSAWEIAQFYTDALKKDLAALNILEPTIWCKATDNIQEQIDLIKVLEDKGFTYKTSDGVYFDTAKVKDYNKLSHLKLDELKEGARVEKNEEKKNPTDFALWKFSFKDGEPFDSAQGRRQMEWDSPWGVGFPGWHVECSAMSLKYLGQRLDIHCGGIDHINVHHTNEIAQSEAATGKKFFNYWLHGAFLNIAGGKKMAKSDDNFLTLQKGLLDRQINPLVYRLSALQVHYRKPMEYGEESLITAQNSLEHLYNQVRELKIKNYELKIANDEYKEKFLNAVNDDLNAAQALAVFQEVLKSDLSDDEKLATVLDFDRVLGLNLKTALSLNTEDLPKEVQEIFRARLQSRADKNWAESDRLRDKLAELGFAIEDTKEETKIRYK